MSESIHICMFQFIVYIFQFIVCIFQTGDIKEDRSGEERVILEKLGQNDGDNEEPAFKKMCLSYAVKGTDGIIADDRNGEADVGSGKEIGEPALKKIKLSEKEPDTGIVRGNGDNIFDVWKKDVTFIKEPELAIETKQVGFHTISTNVNCRCWPSLTRASGRKTRTGVLEVADGLPLIFKWDYHSSRGKHSWSIQHVFKCFSLGRQKSVFVYLYDKSDPTLHSFSFVGAVKNINVLFPE